MKRGKARRQSQFVVTFGAAGVCIALCFSLWNRSSRFLSHFPCGRPASSKLGKAFSPALYSCLCAPRLWRIAWLASFVLHFAFFPNPSGSMTILQLPPSRSITFLPTPPSPSHLQTRSRSRSRFLLGPFCHGTTCGLAVGLFSSLP